MKARVGRTSDGVGALGGTPGDASGMQAHRKGPINTLLQASSNWSSEQRVREREKNRINFNKTERNIRQGRKKRKRERYVTSFCSLSVFVYSLPAIN